MSMLTKMFRGRNGILIIILVVILLVVAANSLPFSTYRSQWEISTEVVAIGVTGEVTNPPPPPFQPPTKPPRPHGFPPEWPWTVYPVSPSSSLEYDFDNPDYGMPDIRASAGDIKSQYSESHGNLTSLREGFKYQIEYKEYIFPVQIRTIAGVKIDTSSERSSTGKTWLTETAMPYEWRDNLGSGGTRVGQPIKGSVYIRVACLPYAPYDSSDFGPAPEGYVFNDYWLGIMNVMVQSSDKGICSFDSKGQPLQQVHQGWIQDIASNGQPLSMSTDDGTFAKPYAPVNWATENVLDPDIKSTIIFEVPFDLKAGAYDTYNAWANLGGGQIEEVDPVNVYVTYTVLVECYLVVQYREPDAPVKPRDIEPPKDWVGNTQLSFWDKYGLWIIIGLVALIILALVATWVGIPIIFLLGRR